MSEDVRPVFDEGQHWPATDAVVLAADEGIAAIVAAAGWKVQPVGSGRDVCPGQPLSARIVAFDWRTQIAGDTLLAALPTDCGILCLVSLQTIDAADALLENFTARFVFGDAPATVAAELFDLQSVLTTHRANDSHRDDSSRLRALSMELIRLASELGSFSNDDLTHDDPTRLADRVATYRAEALDERAPVPPPGAETIRNMIGIRRLRERFFDASLFADPAWDILLDLAAARIEGRSVSVSSLCIAAAVPPTTALRWIRLMTDQQILVRRTDPADARRIFVDLADTAFDQMCGWFALVEKRGGFGL